MTSTACIDTHAPRRRFGRIALLTALIVAMACAGFAISSATAHRAGAATVRPHALNGGVTLSLSVAGVVGEGGVGGPGSIDVNSFQWGVKNSAHGGSGAGSGKAQFSDFTITKMVDRASPAFFRNCVAGQHYKSVTLSVRKAGGTVSDYLTINFGTVLVSSVSWSADATSGQPPTEAVSMAFKTVKVTYTPAPKST